MPGPNTSRRRTANKDDAVHNRSNELTKVCLTGQNWPDGQPSLWAFTHDDEGDQIAE